MRRLTTGCYIPYGDLAQKKGEVPIRLDEILPLLNEMQSVSKELAYPYRVEIEGVGDQPSIGRCGRHIASLDPLRKWLAAEKAKESKARQNGGAAEGL
jgi:hypothetical protein